MRTGQACFGWASMLMAMTIALAAGCGGDGSTGGTADEPEEIDGPGETSEEHGETTGEEGTGTDTTAPPATEPPPGCTPGTGRCEDERTLLLCDDDRTELTVRCASDEVCGARGDGQDCIRIAACQDNDRWCADSVSIATCEDGQPQVRACPPDQACNLGACQDRPDGCEPDTARCRDAITLLECGPDGGREAIVRCASDETCTGEWPDADCQRTDGCPAGTSVCLDDRRARTCIDPEAGWQEITCADGEQCIDGACEGDEPVEPDCAPGTARCTDDGREVCADDGQSWVSVPCDDNQRCVAGDCVDEDDPRICEPGAARCADQTTRETCAEDGTEWTATTCSNDERCEAGACVEDTGGVCTPGSTRCANETTRELCNDAGSAWNASSCDEGTLCDDGDCLPPAQVCTPGTTRCQNGSVELCNDAGSAWNVVETCASGTCQDGECVTTGDPECPGATGASLGCAFRALMLEQISVECTTDTDCADTPGSVCRNQLCRYTSTSDQRFAIGVVNATAQSNTVRIFDGSGAQVASTTLAGRQASLIRVPVPAGHPSGTRTSREAFRITSDRAIAAVQYNPPLQRDATTADASMLLPEHALGLEYDVLTWPSQNRGSGTLFQSYIAIVATEDGTTVDVWAPVMIASGGGISGFGPTDGVRTLSLAEGATVVLQAADSTETGTRDLSGTLLTANRPIAVFAGTTCSQVPTGTSFCDHMESMIPPISAMGGDVVVPKFAPRGNDVDVVRVMNTDTAAVTIETSPVIEGLHQVTLNPGMVAQANAGTSFRVRGSRSNGQQGTIAVAQFMTGSHFLCTQNIFFGWECPDEVLTDDCTRNSVASPAGDPSFVHHTGSEAWSREYLTHVPSNYPRIHVDIVYPAGATIRANDAVIPAGVTVGSTSWRRSRIQPDAGRLHLVGTQPFSATVYGFGCGGSFAYALVGAAP